MTEPDSSKEIQHSKTKISPHDAFWKSLGELTETLTKITQETGEKILKTTTDNIQTVAENSGQKANEIVENLIKTSGQTMDAISQMVDPAVIGGAFVGMSAGEVIGGTVGGLVGSIIGPEGTILGATVGSLAGNYIGLKLGSDVVQEMVKPESQKTPENKVKTVIDFVSLKSGENIGTTLGTIGGATLGTVIAGPVGGIVGSIFGDALGGQLGEDVTRHVQKKIHPTDETTKNLETTLPEWVSNTMRDFLGETGTTVIGRTIGQTVAGPVGAQVGQTLGTITGKKIHWSTLAKTPQELHLKDQEKPS